MDENNFVCTKIDDLWFLGTNDTDTIGNAVSDSSLVPSKLVIPQTIQGHGIDQIGFNAFRDIDVIEEIIITCTPKIINAFAFAHLCKLKYIVIPPSVEELRRAAITAYNISKPEDYDLSEFTSQGIMKIVFLPQSRIQIIGINSLSRKDHIEVYFWEKSSPFYQEDPFYTIYTKSIKIHAPYLSYFCGKRTIRIITLKNKDIILRIHVFIYIALIN